MSVSLLRVRIYHPVEKLVFVPKYGCYPLDFIRGDSGRTAFFNGMIYSNYCSVIVNAIMFCDYEGHGFATDYAMSVESAKFYRVYYNSPVKKGLF